jgi:valyl-tRNA synthetase
MPVVHDAATGRNTSEKFDFGRNFANKLWNATRFALGNLDGASDPTGKPFEFQLADKWILSRLAQTVAETDKALNNYEFSVYAQNLYDFIWRDLCDWYIEVVKPTIKDNPTQQRVLAICFDVALRLLHPAMPFITEKLFAYLNEVVPTRGVPGVSAQASQLLVNAPWPKADASLILPEAEKEFEFLRQCTSGIREARNTYRIAPRQKVVVSVKAPAPIAQKLVENGHIICTLAAVEAREYGPKVDKPDNAAAVVVGDVEIYLHDLVDADAERTRIAKRIEELARNIGGLQGRLGNASYVDRAPAHLVQQTRDQLESAMREADSLRQQLADLK